MSDEVLDEVNTEVLLRIHETGIAVPSSTVLNGHFAIRFANVNHRTRMSDIDVVIDAVLKIGKEVLQQR